jgi:hypothetical protein
MCAALTAHAYHVCAVLEVSRSCHEVFLSTRLINLPHYVEPHAQDVIHRRVRRQVKRLIFSLLHDLAQKRASQRKGVAKLHRARHLSRLRQALSAVRGHIDWRAWRRERAIGLYVKQAFTLLSSVMTAWVQSRRREHLKRRRMLGMRWALANSALARIMGDWNTLAARGRSLLRLFLRADFRSERRLLDCCFAALARFVKLQRIRVRGASHIVCVCVCVCVRVCVEATCLLLEACTGHDT